ncbi:hypothetical protein [Bradyrhizobium sp. AZCC 2289]|uniref:hypothetical protein n=1 Tax=Bradyrhizobium sp. AZCC 2289 TaxID=3117026 RepID=UPI002FEF9429
MKTEKTTLLPATDRRSFLRRAVTALAAGAAVNATAVVATRPAPAAALVQEDPAIVALGERIEPLLATYRNAGEARLKARAVAEANCPAVPEELVSKGHHDCVGYSVSLRDVEGNEILHDVFTIDRTQCVRLPWRILNSEATKAAIARRNLFCDRRTAFGKKLARLIETAEKYEAEREAAIERSGLEDARERQYLAAIDVQTQAFLAFEIEPRTIAGVLVQAQALNACAETEIELGYSRGRSAQLLGIALAQSLTRLSSLTEMV